MDLIQIRYFLALARSLNFTRAAEACNVTQPALTKSIQRLEDELGGPLLLRERSLTQLTELGRTMLPLLEQAYGAAERAKQHAAGLRRQVGAPLRLGLSAGVPVEPFMPVLAELAARLPGFALTLSAGGDAQLNDQLLQGTVDVAVTTGDAALGDRLNRWALFRDAVVVVVRPDHEFAGLAEVPAELLAAQMLIGQGEAGCPSAGLLDRLRPAGGAIVPRHRGMGMEQVFCLVRAGLGVAFSTVRAAAPDGLVRRPVVEPTLDHAVVLAAVAGRPFGRAADALIKLARARDWGDLLHAASPGLLDGQSSKP